MLEYWYMLPIGIIFSTIAMATGIGGAALFTPFFYLIMQIPAAIAVGTGLLIEVFGFGAGLIGFARKKLIHYEVGTYILCFTIPAAIIGALVTGYVPEEWIMTALAVLLLTLSIIILRPDTHTTLKGKKHHEKCHSDKDKCYEEPEDKQNIALLSALGGLFGGLVSTGIGEINDYTLLKKYDMHGPVAAGTSVFVVALTVLAGSITHAYNYFQHELGNLDQIIAILTFAIPGVLIGSQFGINLAEKMDDRTRDKVIGALFIWLAATTIITVLAR